jgi:hypothetical protein
VDGASALAAGGASATRSLASTGSNELGLGALGALLALLGVMLAFSGGIRERRQHTR